MKSLYLKTFLLGFVAFVVFVLPLGAFAGTKEGSDGNFSWKITWPATVQVNVPATIHVEATSVNNMGQIICQLSPGFSTQAVNPSLPNYCNGSSATCSMDCTYTFNNEGAVVLPIQLWSSLSLPNPESHTISVNVNVCKGTICFENPISSLTFWGLFNRIMGFALVIGLAIAPIVLLYGIFRLITATGDAKKVGDAINIIKYTILGVVLLLLARGIVALVINIVLG